MMWVGGLIGRLCQITSNQINLDLMQLVQLLPFSLKTRL